MGRKRKNKTKIGDIFYASHQGWEVESVINGSVADSLGITGNDKIIKLNNSPVVWYHTAIDSLKSNINKPIDIVVKKQNGKIIKHQVLLLKKNLVQLQKILLKKNTKTMVFCRVFLWD